MITLGIESSCDDTSAALVEDGVRIRAGLVSSQIETHRRFGGVVPEVAARKHLEAALPVLREVLQQGGAEIRDIGQVAVTAGPGLLGPLLIGLSTAKAVSWTLGVPLIPVNHLEAHLAAGFLASGRAPVFPHLGLIVSGGHSTLVLARGLRDYEILGRTIDDAPGELFDKVARHLGLGYPGGPVIQKTGETGDRERYRLPRPLAGRGLDFSFSGLKTAVLTLVRREGDSLDVPDLCAGLQWAVAEVIRGKVETALSGIEAKTLVISGGVAANGSIRAVAESLSREKGIELLIPPPALCTDNAAMVAAQGFFSAAAFPEKRLDVNACANWPMGSPAP